MDYRQPFEEGAYYHVYGRTVGKEMAFQDLRFTKLFNQKRDRLIHPYVDICADCIMSNHFHSEWRIKEVDDKLRWRIANERTVMSRRYLAGEVPYSDFLVSQMQRVLIGCANWYNKVHDRHGSLFQKGFKRIRIRTRRKLLYYLAYIHCNPRHHNVQYDFQNYPHSSYQAFLSDVPSRYAVLHVLEWFHPDPNLARISFITLHENFISDPDLEWFL